MHVVSNISKISIPIFIFLGSEELSDDEQGHILQRYQIKLITILRQMNKIKLTHTFQSHHKNNVSHKFMELTTLSFIMRL